MSAAPVKLSTSPSPTPDTGGFFGTRHFLFLGGLSLVILIFAAFLNGIKGPYIFDDADSISNNPSIRSLSTALTPPMQNGITVSGRPVLNLSFALNYLFCKTRNEGMHLGNILIHALAALALFGVVRRTLRLPVFGDRFVRDATWLAWLIAALWAVHPLQTESVTYVVQRAESLVGLFYLLTLYCFIRYTDGRYWRWFAASFVSCLLGMGTKEVMATAPFVIFLYDRTFISGSFRKAWQQHRRLHLAHAAALLLLGALVIASQSRGGSVGTDAIVTRWGYLCTQAYAVTRYTWLSLWPSELTLDYGTLIVRDVFTIISCGLIVIGALAATAWALVRKPMIGFLGVWFFAILAPSSSFIPVNTQTMAEHRMYLPLAAVAIGTAMLTQKFLGRRSWILLAFLILTAAATTIARNRIYLNEATLWTDTVTKAPRNHRGWLSLGAYHLFKAKDPAAARKDIERALKIKPNYPEALSSLGQALIKLGQPDEGLALVEQALRNDPASHSIQAGAGAAFMDCGQYERAIEYFYKALKPDPTNSTLNYNLGNSYMKLGRDTDAQRHFLVAIEGAPSDIDALNNLGTLLRRAGRADEAIDYFTRALGYDPNSSKAHNNIGIAYLTKGNLELGLKHLREAVRLDPPSFESRANLCQALMHTGRYDEAIPLAETLLKEKPDAELYNNLGALYGQTGQLEKAASAFRAALQVDPANSNAQQNLAKLRAYFDAQRKR